MSYIISVAIPSKEMNPTMSVMVVKMTPPAKAGSILSLDKISGRLTPLIAPIIKFIIKGYFELVHEFFLILILFQSHDLLRLSVGF